MKKKKVVRPMSIDMDDSASVLAVESPLANILKLCEERIAPHFHKADWDALDYQEQHVKRANSVALFGSLAVILAIGELVITEGDSLLNLWFEYFLSFVEIVLVGWLVALILQGLRQYLKQEWLLERYKAERLRLLKFSFILEPAMWDGNKRDEDICTDRLSQQVEEITLSTFTSPECWLAEGQAPYVYQAPTQSLTPEQLDSLLKYFQGKRIRFQKDYFGGAVQRHTRRDRKTRIAAPALFFGSVAFVIAHVAIEVAQGAPFANRFFIFLAAALPALGALFRTVRSANEAARNASRFEANHRALLKLEERIQQASTPADLFRELGFCEQILEADHREWTRLMTEAEWFG